MVATGDYVANAIRLRESLQAFHPQARTCLLTDSAIDTHGFDHLRLIDNADQHNPYANDPQVFRKTPFRETIKLEADTLVASPIDHWWTLLRYRDVVISTGCRNWRDQRSQDRSYRQTFDANHLPDVYNAITYWRLSATAKEFFDCVKNIFQHWDQFRRLIKFAPDQPDTDLVYAMAAVIVGEDRVTMPFASYPSMVHMKSAHAGTLGDWTQELVWETDPLRVQTLAQWGLFHYNRKDWQP